MRSYDTNNLINYGLLSQTYDLLEQNFLAHLRLIIRCAITESALFVAHLCHIPIFKFIRYRTTRCGPSEGLVSFSVEGATCEGAT